MRTTILRNKPAAVCDDRGKPPLELLDFSISDPTPPTPGEASEADREFLENATQTQQERAEELRARGYTVTLGPIAWVSPVEAWLSNLLGWECPGCSPDSSEPLDARKIALTLDLPGGAPRDAVKVGIETRVIQQIDREGGATWCESIDAVALTVYADGHFHLGFVEIHGGCEMSHTLVALQRDPPAEVGERVLRALTGIEGFTEAWPAPLYASLKPLNKCQVCGRKLDDPVSRVLQIGPTCAAHMGLEHSERLAEAVVASRKGGA
jgi:hypothetical protein